MPQDLYLELWRYSEVELTGRMPRQYAGACHINLHLAALRLPLSWRCWSRPDPPRPMAVHEEQDLSKLLVRLWVGKI